jgi:uncharacterized repeat protein (TIGR01451 family)
MSGCKLSWSSSTLSKRLLVPVVVGLLAAGGGCSDSRVYGPREEASADAGTAVGTGDRDAARNDAPRGEERIAVRPASNGASRGGERAGGDAAGRMRTESVPMNGQEGGMMRHALAVPTGDRRTSTVLVEQVLPQEARLNRPYDYRIRVTNLTDAPLAGVTVREKLPENFTISKSTPEAKNENGWTSYAVGELPPLGTRTIEVSGVPKAEGQLNTCLAVDYRPTLCATATVINPVLKLTKEGPKESDICEGIRYRYVVSNTGTGTEHDVTIEDALPEGVTTDDGRRAVSIRVGDVPQGQSKEFNVRVKAAKTGQYASAAVAKAPGASEVRSEEVSTLVRQPKLDVAVSGPEKEYINKTATYTVTVKNNGDAPARRAVLGIDAGNGATVGTVAVGSGGNDAQVAAAYRKEGTDLETIAPGETRTVTVTVRANKEGQLPLKATAVAGCVTPVSAAYTTNILTLPALRLEVIDLDDPIRVGDAVVYRVTVKNQGTGADRNVGVTATLPPELQFVTSEGPTQAKAEGQTIRLGTVETLGAGQTAVWRIEAKALRGGDVRLRVDLKSDSLGQAATETEPTRLY